MTLTKLFASFKSLFFKLIAALQLKRIGCLDFGNFCQILTTLVIKGHIEIGRYATLLNSPKIVIAIINFTRKMSDYDKGKSFIMLNLYFLQKNLHIKHRIICHNTKIKVSNFQIAHGKCIWYKSKKIMLQSTNVSYDWGITKTVWLVQLNLRIRGPADSCSYFRVFEQLLIWFH